MDKIDQPLIIDAFNTHVGNPNNKRILFSAPFGSGKSTFLSDYFDGRENKFIAIKLYPVNYAVSDNNDVFELIKFDILCELLGKYKQKISLQKEDFSTLLKSQLFTINHLEILPVLEAIVSASSKIGKASIEILQAFKKVYSDYQKYTNDTEIDEEKIIENYLKRFSNKPGVHEMDDMTFLISDLLKRCKGETDLKTVLVIDDLDRLDPEHVFRLFNVFSAHYDGLTETNKFNFDKVIFVCDIKNIRKMFYHRYGKGVDFSGYIDKFYSKNVFEFDNSKYIKESLELLFAKIDCNSTNAQICNQYLVNKNTNFRKAFFYLLHSLISSKQLTIRSLAHIERLDMPNYDFKVNGEYRNSNPAIVYPFLVLISYLKTIFTDIETIDNVLEVLANNFDEHLNVFDEYYDNERAIEYLLESALIFLVDVENAFVTISDSRIDNMKPFNGVYIHYSIDTERISEFKHNKYNYIHISNVTKEPISTAQKVKINVFSVLSKALKNCLKRQYVS